MTASQFEAIWRSRYALTPPISYLLKDAYPERWLRIHSLPESKRYPENNSDWRILLYRQNSLIEDLIGSDSDTLIVTGDYDFNSTSDHEWEFSLTDSIRQLPFTELRPIPLETLIDEKSVEEYKPGDLYRPIFSEIHWQPSAWDKILIDIAQDELRAFFVSLPNELIIAPYDGGVDIILNNESTRDKYKAKYKDWLSDREDGL